VTYHLILILNQQFDALYGCSRCLGHSLEGGGKLDACGHNKFKNERTAETPPIRKSTEEKGQVSSWQRRKMQGRKRTSELLRGLDLLDIGHFLLL
jgi:hypothetical protein